MAEPSSKLASENAIEGADDRCVDLFSRGLLFEELICICS